MSSDEIKKMREAFHRKLRSRDLLEGFSYDDSEVFHSRPYWPLEPKNNMAPHLWKWSDVWPLILESGEMVGLGKGAKKYDRRVLALSNPGSQGDFTLTGTLFGDYQLIRPGESAPCHRHTPSATRFILGGTGGWTSVSGEKVHLAPGDIVHTGQFPWHDHGNEGKDDFVFLDVLDIPLLYFTGTSCWEFDSESVTGSKEVTAQPVEKSDFRNGIYVQSHLRPSFRPSWRRNPKDFAHLSWNQAQSTLLSLEGEKGSEYDGIRMEFRSTEGGPVGTTVSVHTQWIRPKEKTLSHRHTGATAYVCIDGAGRVEIEKQIFEFGPRDVFVVPSWHWHAFQSDGGCFLHSISDLALIQKMSLYREQRRGRSGELLDSGWTDQLEPFER